MPHHNGRHSKQLGSSPPYHPKSNRRQLATTHDSNDFPMVPTSPPSGTPSSRVVPPSTEYFSMQVEQSSTGPRANFADASQSAAAATGATASPSAAAAAPTTTAQQQSPHTHVLPGGWCIALDRPLGKGTWSTVYCATSPAGDACAAKVVPKAKLKPHETQFPHIEAHMLQQIHHQNVVRLLHTFEDASAHYLFLELVRGQDLFTYLEKHRRMHERFARRVFGQIADAVHGLHQLGIVHRDLKLENILMSSGAPNDPEQRHVTLLDFGLAAQLLSPDDRLSEWCGSPLYASIELINKVPYRTEVDVWALGIILYCMVAGYQPFYGKAVSEIFTKIRSQRLEFPEHFSGPLRDLLARMLDRDPLRRISMAELRRHPWMRATTTTGGAPGGPATAGVGCQAPFVPAAMGPGPSLHASA